VTAQADVIERTFETFSPFLGPTTFHQKHDIVRALAEILKPAFDEVARARNAERELLQARDLRQCEIDEAVGIDLGLVRKACDVLAELDVPNHVLDPVRYWIATTELRVEMAALQERAKQLDPESVRHWDTMKAERDNARDEADRLRARVFELEEERKGMRAEMKGPGAT
jgi:hypothetical protein